jgi:ATP-dependent DNA helicase HFM1/MER3
MKPRLSHELTAINELRHKEESNISVTRSRGPKMTYSNLKSRQDLENFDGDDLQLDDFLATKERRHKAKDSTNIKILQLEDADWLSIASASPRPPEPVSKGSNDCEDDWTAESGGHVHEEYEPIRFANGKWACNHKCKDKTRFVNISFSLENGLTITVASISVAGKVWINRPQSLRSGLPLGLRRMMVSIN